MVLTLAMSFAVTSSMTWWVLRPLIAANMPRIIAGLLLRPWRTGRLGDLCDGGRVDAGRAADREGHRALLAGRDALDDARDGLARRGVRVGHRPPDESERARQREAGSQLLVGGGE